MIKNGFHYRGRKLCGTYHYKTSWLSRNWQNVAVAAIVVITMSVLAWTFLWAFDLQYEIDERQAADYVNSVIRG